jgi:hypothetical protein
MHVYPLPKAELPSIHSAADSGTNAPRPNREATLASGRFRCQYAVAGSRHSSSTSSLRDTQPHCAHQTFGCGRRALRQWCGGRLRDQASECIFVRCGAVQCSARAGAVLLFAPWRSFLSLIRLQHRLSALRMRIDGNAERRTQEYLRFRRHEQPSFDSMEVRLWQHTRAVRQRKLQQPSSDQLESLVMAATPVRAKVSGVCDYPRGSNAQCCPQVLLQQRNLPPNRPNAPSCLPR